MENENKRIIEINGVKLEVDLRTAKKIDVYKVGDPVKVIDYNYSNPSFKPGVIVDFAEFKSTSAIEVMVLSDSYNGVEFEFISICNQKAGDKIRYEIAPYNKYEKLFTKGNILDRFQRLIEKKKIEIDELERKREYFVKDFEKAFELIKDKEND